jgi:hypothetical protein
MLIVLWDRLEEITRKLSCEVAVLQSQKANSDS